jgi:hypothetical protein
LSLPSAYPRRQIPNKILLGNNAVLFVDSEGDNTELYSDSGPGNLRYIAHFSQYPLAKQHLFNCCLNCQNVLTAGMLEVRGFVSLFRRRRISWTRIPPVKVLLNPEIRGTFLPNDFPSPPNIPANTELDFDQINYTLAIASGKGLNEIPPEPLEPFRSSANL